jgi:TonB-linked SusC/RagA family outer membrane protein
MKKVLQSCFLLFLLTITQVSLAQDKRITGKVTSKDDGLPLPGVSVKVAGSTLGTQTDGNGNYTLSVSSTARSLEFSFIGFLAQSVTIGAKTSLDVSLTSDEKQLSEVVVTGYGVQQKKDLAGAVTQLKGEVIENMPIQSFDRAMQGRMSGVQVSGNSGIPGGAVTVRIRGTGSINAGNNPLYVIDGVQVEGGDLSRSITSSNALAGLNPNDIESIDVLKDASAAAIYGAQAANGVILITTKKGKSGKTKFSATYQTGTNELLNGIPITNGPQFLQGVYESRANLVLNQGGNPLTDPRTTTNFVSTYGFGAGNFDQAPTYDWLDAATRTGITNTVEISASGGDEKTTFFLSSSFNKTQGQLIFTDFGRGTLRANISHKASKKISFDTKLNLATYTQNAIPSANNGGSILFSAVLTPTTQPIYNPDGSFAEPLLGPRTANAIKNVTLDKNRGTTNQLTGSTSVNYQIFKDLSFKSSYYIDYTDILEDAFTSPETLAGSAFGGQVRALNTRNINWSTDQVFNYTKKFGTDHDFGALAGFSYRNVVTTTITATGRSLPNALFQTLQSTATPFATSANFTTWRLSGYFSRFNYTYKGKYILNGTLRYDGSSRFGAENKYGLFPSVSAAYRLSEEKFFKNNVSFVNNLKLRGSYGITGNSNIGNFDAISLFIGTGAYNNQGGIQPSQLGNNLLTWEENHSLNVGLDYGLFNNRITGSLDAFRRDSKNLLLDRPLPSTSGFGSISQNVGQVRNEGLEFEINSINVDKKFKWSTNFNFTLIRNEVIKLNEGQERIGTTVFVGESLGSVFNLKYAGVNAATGRGFWLDKDNNPTYLPLTSGVNDARRIVGSTLPTSFGGLTNTFSFKGFEASVLLQSQFGNLLQNANSFFVEAAGAFEIPMSQRAFDRRWLTPGQITDQPRPYGGSEANHRGMTGFTSRNFEDGSYIRLKQVALSYDFNQKLLSKIKVSNLKLFMQAVNLATITGYTGFDPEVTAGDQGIFPQGRAVTVGIQIGL